MARRSWPWYVGLTIINIIAYGYSPRVPFMLDDVVHLRWLDEHGVGAILSSAAGLSYYRPLNFLLWKVLWMLQGQYHAPTMHLFNLLAHFVSTVLLMRLLRMIRPPGASPWVPFVAALLFALFPFSYQAVPWVGSLAHISVMALMLSALVLALSAQRVASSQARAWALAGSLVCTFLAPFAHEVGLMTVPLLLLLMWADESGAAPTRPAPTNAGGAAGAPSFALPRALRAVGPHILAAALALGPIVYVRATTLPSTKISPTFESLYQTGAYFLQGLTYPLAPLAWLLRGRLDDIQAVYIAGLLVLAAWLWLLRRSGQRKPVILALGWFGLCMLPAWLALKLSYVIDGPRLLYQASAGIALLWAAPLEALATPAHVSRAKRVVFAAVPLIALAGSTWFLQDKGAMYEQAIRMVDQLKAVTGPQVKGPTLLVNYPRWLAPRTSWFALGHEGVSVVPEYASMFDYYWTISGHEVPIEDAFVEDIKKPWRFNYALVGTSRSSEDMQGRLRNNARTVFADLSTPNVIVYDAGELEGQQVPKATSYIAAYDGKLAVVTGTLQADGRALFVNLVWQFWQKLPQEMNTFVHVQKPSGELVAQTDGFPIANLARPSFWQVGDQWRERRLIPLPPDLPAGEYLVRVGVYPTAGGDRLSATASDGTRYENDSALVGHLLLH